MSIRAARLAVLFEAACFAALTLGAAASRAQVVTSAGDSGPGSLRAAVAAATPHSVITFAPSLHGQTIRVTSDPIEIGVSLTIEGLGRGVLTVSAAPAREEEFEPHRLFTITGRETEVEIRGLTLRDGKEVGTVDGDGGGAIWNRGRLTLEQVTVLLCRAEFHGGAILNLGSLTARDCIFSSNAADSNGGAIANFGALRIDNSLIMFNETPDAGGGLYQANPNASGAAPAETELTDVALLANRANFGGAVSANQGRLSMDGGSAMGNEAHYDGGAVAAYGYVRVALNGVRIVGNASGAKAGANGGGGAFVQTQGEFSLVDATIEGNRGPKGGGLHIRHGGEFTMRRCTVADNTASYRGGGLYHRGLESTIDSSTISGNHASAYGGGVDCSGRLTMQHATVAYNTAGVSGGGCKHTSSLNLCELYSTLIAGNAAATGPDVDGAFDSHGGNLLSNADNPTAVVYHWTDQVGTTAAPLDARLGPLADHGGPTRTHALQAGSPAIDRGDSQRTQVHADQRGLPRPIDLTPWVWTYGSDKCDVGAVEMQGLLAD